MSWLTGLASKAEEMLNKVDATAAATLSQKDAENMSNEWQRNSSVRQDLISSTSSTISGSASVPSNLNKLNNDPKYTSQTSRPLHLGGQGNSPLKSLSSKKDKDEELFEFLNSPETVETKKRDKQKVNANMSNGKHSRQSSTSSTTSNKSRTKAVDALVDVTSTEEDVALSAANKQEIEPLEDKEHCGSDVQDDFVQDSSSGYQSRQDDSTTQQHLSSLELENRLLKSEVASLNQEMSTVIQRAKHSKDELQRTKQKLETHNQHFSQTDQMVRELQARETDLIEALKAKDSQLAVLRVRFEESDKELRCKKQLLEEIEGEKNRILQDHASASGVHGQALETLREKLMESESALQHQQESSRTFQQESMQRQSKLEAEQKSLAELLSEKEKALLTERGRLMEMKGQLKTTKNQAESFKQQLAEYKDKAARILQSKDKLISSLKEGSGLNQADSGLASAELEEVKQERELLREEVQQNRMTVENLRQEIQDLESQLQTDADAAHDQIDALEDQLKRDKSTKEDAEQEVARQRQELRFAHEELLRQKTAFQNRLQDREQELDRLRNQLTAKSVSSTSQVELESRLHTLTESLIQKQTLVEALSTEKNSLVLQLERLEHQYSDLQACTSRASATALHINEDEEVRQRLPGFLRELPQDGETVRKVKRAAGSIDKFSIRLGVFLRRYPIARVFVISYMFLLHLWVMIVLLTYKPEIHDTDYHHPQPPGPQGP